MGVVAVVVVILLLVLPLLPVMLLLLLLLRHRRRRRRRREGQDRWEGSLQNDENETKKWKKSRERSSQEGADAYP